MASVHNVCYLCEEEDVSNIAVVWCADCETFLCKDCERHHSKNRASKGHQTISQDEYNKLPSFIVDIKNRCNKHDQKNDFYCMFHGDPCCVKCIKDKHKDCRDLEPLVEVLRGIKTSAKVSNLDKEFNILLENFDTVVKYLNIRKATLHENKTESLTEIQNLRASINKHLDIIEQKIMDDISVEFNKIKQKSNHIFNEISNKKVVIQNLQNDLAKMTMYATDLQIYVGLQYLEKSTLEEVGYLNELQGQLEEIRLESKLSSDLKCLTNNIRKFGTAVVHSSPCTLQLKSSGEHQVNLSVSHLLTIDSINPKLTTTLRVPKMFKDINIYGCQVLSDSRNLFLDTVSKSLLLFSKEGEYIEKVISFNDEPNDLCYIKGSLIAVTFFRVRKLLLVDLLQKQIKKTIRLTGLCFGIDSDGKMLVVSLHDTPERNIVTLDLEGNILSEIVVPGECTIRTALHKNNIVCSDWKDNHIYCYTNKGILLWKYKHEGICEPFGITIDTNGFIYVACKGNDKIVVLSQDGKTSRTILSKENGIDDPCAVNVNKTLSTLLVTNSSNGDAFVFKI